MQQLNSNQKILSVADRSARSIFVGNISYDVTEEQLKQILSQIGQVVHFRLVHDRETGKPKGFGFCEYIDVQTAENAQKTLNGYEINGRQLRVDSATGGERSADEVEQFQLALAGHQEESPYGPEPETGKAPEAIARTMASMPPERMFELMRNMKETVLTNPTMAKQLLNDNPQLAYALLQAQVVMRVVDPKVAYSMLHREQPASLTPFHLQIGANNKTVGVPNFNGPPQQTQANIAASNQQYQMPSPNYGLPLSHKGPVPSSIQKQHVQPTQIQSQPQQISPQSNTNDDEAHQAQMLVKVLQLTDKQIEMLPPEDRAKVIELRNQLRRQVP